MSAITSNLSRLKKIKQIATKAVYDWNKLRRLERLVDQIGTLKVNATELDTLLDHVFNQVTGWVGSESALLAQRKENGRFERLFATGSLCQEPVATHYLDRLSERGGHPEETFERDFVCFQLERYDLVVLLEKSQHLNTKKLYLLELFVRHAGQAIENIRLHEALVRGEKLAAVGLAIGKVAHDLRSPISAIKGAVNLIRENPEDRPLQVDMLDVISISSEDAFVLVADLLAFARNDGANVSLQSTAGLFKKIRQRMDSHLALLGISLRVESENVETFSADGNKLQRAVINLLQNAAEALDASSTLKPSILLRVTREGEDVRIDVADNGPGIPALLEATLFEPFITHGKPGGTVLGLAIVRQAAEAHGGRVEVTSSEEGTRFSIFLPQCLPMPPVESVPRVDTLAVVCDG
jgi:signal transduction histidine kinase